MQKVWNNIKKCGRIKIVKKWQKVREICDSIILDTLIVANVVNHVIITQGPKQSLHNSIHASTNQSIINLSPRDLRHKINSLRHKSKDHYSGFALIYAAGIPGQSRINKLDYVRDILASMTGYVDLTWKFYDQQAAIIVEFINQSHIQQVIQHTTIIHQDLNIRIIDDLRHLID